MIGHRRIDAICLGALALAVGIVLVFSQGERLGIQPAHATPGYVSRLFDDRRVHQIDLQVEDWAAFVEHAPEEEYLPCTVVIDGEEFRQVGLRAKGNNSLSLTEEYGLSRYSLKLEFDHFLDGGTYHGLDKFSLDASFQDNSYLKTYLAYDMMDAMGVPVPLCAYAWVTVNGTAMGALPSGGGAGGGLRPAGLWLGVRPALPTGLPLPGGGECRCGPPVPWGGPGKLRQHLPQCQV